MPNPVTPTLGNYELGIPYKHAWCSHRNPRRPSNKICKLKRKYTRLLDYLGFKSANIQTNRSIHLLKSEQESLFVWFLRDKGWGGKWISKDMDYWKKLRERIMKN